jgi:hypothetical protein
LQIVTLDCLIGIAHTARVEKVSGKLRFTKDPINIRLPIAEDVKHVRECPDKGEPS